MRLRPIVIAATVAISAATMVSPSVAAPKAGKPCATVGVTVTKAGTTFVCRRSGTRLVWRATMTKPMRATPAPSSPTRPTPTATPTAAPTAVPAAPTGFADLIENYRGISYAAWSTSRAQILQSAGETPTYTLLLGPSSSWTFNDLTRAVGLVHRLYPEVPIPPDLVILGFNYNDRGWATQEMDRVMPSAGSRWISETACRTRETCWGGGAFSDQRDRVLMVVTTDFDGRNHREGTLDAHEFTHVLQIQAFGLPTVWPRPSVWPPSWFWEGQAQFSQNAAIFHDSYPMYMQRRLDASRELFGSPTYTSEYLRSFFVANQSAAWFATYPHWRQYDLGALFVEILVALKGPGAVMDLWRITGQTRDFEAAFQTVFGISLDEAVPIMAEAIARQLADNYR